MMYPTACSTHLLRALAALVVVCPGCSDPGGQQAVSGDVTWGGTPLQQGYVTFRPVGEGRGSGSMIKDGQFEIRSDRGLQPGEYQVLITSQVPTGKQIPNPEVPGEQVPETRQAIPKKYNVLTQLTATVEMGGDNHFTFALDKD